MMPDSSGSDFFFFNDTATTEIYTLSLHDALPISEVCRRQKAGPRRAAIWPEEKPIRISRECCWFVEGLSQTVEGGDRKSTRLNSSHSQISYAVFCLKKKTPSRDR